MRWRWTVFVIPLLLFPLTAAIRPTRAASDTLRVRAIQPEASAISIYEVSFTLSQPLPADGSLILTFPQPFDLSRVVMAGSSTINGGFHVAVEGQRVILKRSGLGRVIPANTKVDVKFANVKNPLEAREDYAVRVEVLNGRQERIKAFEKTPVAVKAKLSTP